MSLPMVQWVGAGTPREVPQHELDIDFRVTRWPTATRTCCCRGQALGHARDVPQTAAVQQRQQARLKGTGAPAAALQRAGQAAVARQRRLLAPTQRMATRCDCWTSHTQRLAALQRLRRPEPRMTLLTEGLLAALVAAGQQAVRLLLQMQLELGCLQAMLPAKSLTLQGEVRLLQQLRMQQARQEAAFGRL